MASLLSREELTCFVLPILHPLIRASEDGSKDEAAETVKMTADGVLKAVQAAVGNDTYLKGYTHVRSSITQKRSQRRIDRRTLAVTDPTRHAALKITKNIKKKGKKKEKIEQFKLLRGVIGKKKDKKRAIDEEEEEGQAILAKRQKMEHGRRR